MTTLSDAIEGAGFGRFQWIATVFGGGVYLADGAEVMILGGVTKQLTADWGLSSFQRGLIVSVVFFGTFLANIFAGTLADKVGRRPMLLASYVGVFVSSMLSLLAFNAWSLAVLRFLVGVFFGSGGPAWNALGAEISPISQRLWVAGVSQCMFALGEAYSAILLWASGPDYAGINWRVLILLGSLPCVALGLGAWKFLTESPRFSLKKGQLADTQKTLTLMYHYNKAETAPMIEVGENQELNITPSFLRNAVNIDILRAIFAPKYLYTTLTICICTFTLNFSYYGGLYVFPQVFESSAGPSLLLSSLLEIPGFLFGVWLGERTTRRQTMLIYVGLSALAAFAMLHPFTLRVGVFCMKFFGSVGWLVFYLYSAEVFPTECRTSASGFCMASGRLGGIIAPLVFETAKGGKSTFFTTIFALLLCNFMLVLFLPFETQNAQLDSSSIALNTGANIFYSHPVTKQSIGKQTDDSQLQ